MANNRLKGLMSSDTPEWYTPRAVFDALDREFGFRLDPCAAPDRSLTVDEIRRPADGLAESWHGRGPVFMNPPYGRVIGDWMRKARAEADLGETVVCLVPARTDTAWWHETAIDAEIRLVRGRIHFSEGGAAPFPSAAVIMGPKARVGRFYPMERGVSK